MVVLDHIRVFHLGDGEQRPEQGHVRSSDSMKNDDELGIVQIIIHLFIYFLLVNL
jgi:hypothetical protein